jgi:hypothetical protein
MPIHSQHIGNLGTQAVVNLNLSAAGLAKDRNLYAIAKAARAFAHQQIHILYIGMGSDGVIGHVIGYVLNEGIVPYSYVVQRRVPQTGVLSDASGKGEDLLKTPKLHGAGKTDIAYVVQGFGM